MLRSSDCWWAQDRYCQPCVQRQSQELKPTWPHISDPFSLNWTVFRAAHFPVKLPFLWEQSAFVHRSHMNWLTRAYTMFSCLWWHQIGRLNWLWWEYLRHKNWRALQRRAIFFWRASLKKTSVYSQSATLEATFPWLPQSSKQRRQQERHVHAACPHVPTQNHLFPMWRLDHSCLWSMCLTERFHERPSFWVASELQIHKRWGRR